MVTPLGFPSCLTLWGTAHEVKTLLSIHYAFLLSHSTNLYRIFVRALPIPVSIVAKLHLILTSHNRNEFRLQAANLYYLSQTE